MIGRFPLLTKFPQFFLTEISLTFPWGLNSHVGSKSGVKKSALSHLCLEESPWIFVERPCSRKLSIQHQNYDD